MVMKTEPRVAGVNYAIKFGDVRERNESWISNLSAFDVANDLSGVAAFWLEGHAPEVRMFSGPVEQITTWLPHPDFAPAREFTNGSSMHKAFWRKMELRGTLTLRGQLDLWQMLIPATQPLSKLDYEPEPETVTVTFKSDAALTLAATGAEVVRVN